MIDTDSKNYHPVAQMKRFKNIPGKENSRAWKNIVHDDFEVFDSYTDDIDLVYSELDSFRGSVVQDVAESIKSQLENFTGSGYLSSDSLQKIDTLIQYAYNLEILESAIVQFEAEAGCEVHVGTFASPASVYVRYENHTADILTQEQVRKVLAAYYSSKTVENLMMFSHSANVKKYGEPLS